MHLSYLEAAERTGEWLLATADRGPQGWSWPGKPSVSAEVEPGLGSGTAGPVMFFVEAFRTTGDERWVRAAREGVRWMDAYLDECVQRWGAAGCSPGSAAGLSSLTSWPTRRMTSRPAPWPAGCSAPSRPAPRRPATGRTGTT